MRFLSFLAMSLVLLAGGVTHLTEVKAADAKERWINNWREDIDYLQRELETGHLDLYHQTTSAEFSRQLTHIKEQLPHYHPSQLLVELMRAVKQIGDGHTQLNYWGGLHHRYPIQLKWFATDLRVVGTDPANRDLLGMRLTAIDELPLEAAMQRLKPVLLGVENRYSEQHQLAVSLPVAELLHGLDISKQLSTARFTFADDSNRQVTRQIKSLTAEKAEASMTAFLRPQLPAGFVRHGHSIPEVGLYINAAARTAYLPFDHYPSHSAMVKFAEALPAIFKKNNIRRVIIDVRHNGGGDFFVGLILAWGLVLVDSLDWHQGTYVLTGGQTFSAAMSNAAQFRQILNAKIVGEPTGANPVGYQDAGTFTLPNSGWRVMYAKRYYRFQDFPSAGLQPDVLLPPDWLAYKSGRDNQLEWVMNDVSRPQIQPIPDAPFAPVLQLFGAMSALDHERLRDAVTEDFVLLEQGEVWTIENLVALARPSPYQRHNYFREIRSERRGNMAWINYWNKAIFAKEDDEETVLWLESVVVIKQAGRWRIAQMHSTRVPLGHEHRAMEFAPAQ